MGKCLLGRMMAEALGEGYLETKLQDTIVASNGVNEASGEDMGINPKQAKDGVYILHTNGKLYEIDSWNQGSKDAVGVALKIKKCRFVIAPEQITNIPWSPEYKFYDEAIRGGYTYLFDRDQSRYKYVLVPNCKTIANENKAIKDFDGIGNTTAIVNFWKNTSMVVDIFGGSYGVTSKDCAAIWCSEYTFKNGKKGYLGAFGELCAIAENVEEINKALIKIDGTPFSTKALSNARTQWSSTQQDREAAWSYIFGYGERDKEKRAADSGMGARPLTKL